MRRFLVVLFLVIAALLAVNTLVTDNETKEAKADIGRIVNLPGGDLQVREDGARGRPTIVLLHGFAGSVHWWTPVAERLSRSFHVVRIDLLGHGGSEKPGEGYSMPDQAKLVARALAAIDVQRAVIAGHSMGGTVATALAELDPSVVDGLVLVASPPDGKAGELPFVARLGFVPVLGEAIRRVVPDGVVEDNVGKAFAGDFAVPDQFVEDFRSMTYTSYDASHNGTDDYQDERPVVKRLARLRQPLLVIYGAEDEFVEPSSVEQFRDVPGAIVNSLPGTGHSPMLEEPAETARKMSAFAGGASSR